MPASGHRGAANFHPAAESLKIVAIAASSHRREILLGLLVGKCVEQQRPQNAASGKT